MTQDRSITKTTGKGSEPHDWLDRKLLTCVEAGDTTTLYGIASALAGRLDRRGMEDLFHDEMLADANVLDPPHADIAESFDARIHRLLTRIQAWMTLPEPNEDGTVEDVSNDEINDAVELLEEAETILVDALRALGAAAAASAPHRDAPS